ncbi:MAG: dethiobiotin synthase [Nitrosomonas sp.]|nr:dethiobiotin synthase [Nitrosomonas sp.]MCW5608496.1 dethiobiotin synthase [Nitrosomonas sp.]
MSAGFFVTGTDTGIGKTYVSCLLLQALVARHKSAVGMKPIAAGSEHGQWQDVELLRAAGNVEVPRDYLNPYALQMPIAPHIAAGQEGVTIEIAHIEQCYDRLARNADVVVVEGIGGFLVPINTDETTADLARALNLSVLLVVGMRLGCISHALLTVQAIQQTGLRLAGWVANCIDPDMLALEENITTLQQRIDAPLLGKVPFSGNSDLTQQVQCIDAEKLIQMIGQGD